MAANNDVEWIDFDSLAYWMNDLSDDPNTQKNIFFAIVKELQSGLTWGEIENAMWQMGRFPDGCEDCDAVFEVPIEWQRGEVFLSKQRALHPNSDQ